MRDHDLMCLRRNAQADPGELPAYVAALERALGLEVADGEPSFMSVEPGPVTEGSDGTTVEGWYSRARRFGKEGGDSSLDDFVSHLVRFEHGYGTICHAMAAAAIAAVVAINNDPRQGGITGFQAGAVMWEFVRRWNHLEGPLRLVQFKNMLYPQYESDFEKTISAGVFDQLEEMAARLLERGTTSDRVREHAQRIVDGVPPFGYTVKG